MEKNAEEKSLEKINKNSLFSKIKKFFKNLFSKNKNADVSTEENTNDNIIDADKKNSFMEDVKKVEDEETSILKLQTKYRKGEIGEKDLTAEQIDALCELYDKQIAELKKSIELKKQKILEYKAKNK